MKVLILTADDVEDLELFYPYYRLKEAGHQPSVASILKGKLTCKHGYTFDADMSFREVKPDDYDALLIPGGRAPERVRLDNDALSILRNFLERRAPIAAICHGPQLLISAGAVKGRRMTCWKGIKDDLIAAGARYEDKEVVVDDNFVTSRQPSDLPEFMDAFLKLLLHQKAPTIKAKN